MFCQIGVTIPGQFALWSKPPSGTNAKFRTDKESYRDMYRFSRSIYRDLAPRVIEDPRDPGGCRRRQELLEACEAAVRRISTDRRYFARPAPK